MDKEGYINETIFYSLSKGKTFLLFLNSYKKTYFNWGLYQSLAVNGSDEQIEIWILFAKKHIIQVWIWILFLTPWVTNMNKNIISKKNHEYIPIFEYIQAFEKNPIPGYCYLPVWRLWIIYQNLSVTFHTAD